MSKGVGLDIGTMNLVSARMSGKKNEVTLRRMRDLFIDLPEARIHVLQMSFQQLVRFRQSMKRHRRIEMMFCVIWYGALQKFAAGS